MEDKYCVRYIYYKEGENKETYICTQSSYSFGEMIKYLHYCKKYNVIFYPRDDSDKIKEEDKKEFSMGGYIEEFYVEFGDDDYIPVIVVVLK